MPGSKVGYFAILYDIFKGSTVQSVKTVVYLLQLWGEARKFNSLTESICDMRIL